MSSAVRDHNRRAWDGRVRRRALFTQPATAHEMRRGLAAFFADGWLDRGIAGRRVLCLAAGGGYHSALLAAAGAHVTVVDISAEMLALDRQVAAERELDIRTIEGSMDDLGALPAESFDLVIQPVSTCYVPDVLPVYREVARVTACGALYISQHKQPASMQAGIDPTADGYVLSQPYYQRGPLPAVRGSPHREEGTLEFLHRLEELLGGMCRAGFVIEDVVEPLHARPGAPAGSFAHRSSFVPPYLRVKARRVQRGRPAAGPAPTLWTPDRG